MRYKKLLLVITKLCKRPLITPCVSMGYLAAMLEQEGIEYNVVDMNLGYDKEELLTYVKAYKPDLVAFNIHIVSGYPSAYDLVDSVTAMGYHTIMGGVLVFTFRSKALQDSRATYAMKGEGEYSLLDLCRGADLRNIPGLIFREGNTIVEHDKAPYVEDLNSIPFPTYKNFELAKYPRKGITIMSSRGCAYNCKFCQVSLMSNNMFRARSAGSIFKEIEYWYKKGYRNFDFGDDNLLFQKERICKLCDLIEENKLTGMNFRTIGIRADLVEKDIVSRLNDVGFSYYEIGVESGSERVLKSMNKAETVKQMKSAIKILTDTRAKVFLGITVGYPGETVFDVLCTLCLALSYPVAFIIVRHLIPIPGTELYKWVEKKGYTRKSFEDCMKLEFDVAQELPVFETPELSLRKRRILATILRWTANYLDFRYYSLIKIRKVVELVKQVLLFRYKFIKIRGPIV